MFFSPSLSKKSIPSPSLFEELVDFSIKTCSFGEFLKFYVID